MHHSRIWSGLILLALVPALRAQDEPKPEEKDPKRFREEVQVVAEPPGTEVAPAELPVRPTTVMAVAGSADNVFRTLQTLPGVAATDEFDSRLSVRGGSPDENLTVMDGVEIHNPYRLFGLTSAFNPETRRRLRPVRGGFSALYGDRLSSLLVVENRAGTRERGFAGSSAVSLTDANAVFEGRLPGGARLLDRHGAAHLLRPRGEPARGHGAARVRRPAGPARLGAAPGHPALALRAPAAARPRTRSSRATVPASRATS